MKPSAVGLVSILTTVIALLLLSSPAAARSMKMTPNDTACKGGYDFCHGLCNAQYGGPGQAQQWEDCVNKCRTERKICDANDDIGMTAGSLSSPNTEVFDPTGTGGTGGGGGSGTGGTHSLNSAGMNAGGGTAVIF